MQLKSRIARNGTGYVLRPDLLRSAGYLVLAVLMVGLGIFLLIPSSTVQNENAPPYGVGAITGIGGGLMIFWTQISYRLVVDEKGIRLYRFGFCRKFLPWERVWDWGMTTKEYRGIHVRGKVTEYTLFFSYINGPTLELCSISLEISQEDYRTLPKTAFWRFVRSQVRKAKPEAE